MSQADPPTPLERPIVPVVVQQHAEESAILRNIRSVLVRAPHVGLRHLARLDERIAAHLDGLAVAGSAGRTLCRAGLERLSAGTVFALAVRVIAERDARALDRLVALALADAQARRGLLSALGWQSKAQLQGIVLPLLAAGDPQRAELALGACRLHGADPGAALASALQSQAPALRAAAWRAAGELGRVDLRDRAPEGGQDDDAAVRLQAAIAGCLLGAHDGCPGATGHVVPGSTHDAALDVLEAIAFGDGPARHLALRPLLLASDLARGRDTVRRLVRQATPEAAAHRRRVVVACGLLGDPDHVAWLIEAMDDDRLARVAGEAFTLVTGADLAALDLERKPPARVPTAASDDANDDDVALDDDESLPWPDRALVQRWWEAHGATLPPGSRAFLGAAPTREHCIRVLREGRQRQRFAAAFLLKLQFPGGRLFPVAAPAWRQRRLLAA